MNTYILRKLERWYPKIYIRQRTDLRTWEGEGEMYGEDAWKLTFTICKLDSKGKGICCMSQGTLYQPRGIRMGREMGGRGHVYLWLIHVDLTENRIQQSNCQ